MNIGNLRILFFNNTFQLAKYSWAYSFKPSAIVN